MNDLMVDLETLGTGPTAIIIAIGAVKFDLASGKIDDRAFYASVSVDSNLEAGRTMSESTLIWWMKQSEEARAVFSEEKIPLQEALEQFSDWIGNSDPRVWGNGPSFDLAKITDACEHFHMQVPWMFWNERCVRTYRNLPGAKAVPKVEPAIAHNAMYDAHAQAQHIINIHQALFNGAAGLAKINSMVKQSG